MTRAGSRTCVSPHERGLARVPWPHVAAAQHSAGNFLEVTIGREVRSHRRQLGITLVELARAAGLSLGMMSKIENGIISASLSTLQALSQALGVPLTALFRTFDDIQRDPLFVRAAVKERVGQDAPSHQNLFTYLGFAAAEIVLEPQLVTLTKATGGAPLLRHPGMKLVFYLLEGELDYRHGIRLYHMVPGDSLLFNADVIHGPCGVVRLPVFFLSFRSSPLNGTLRDAGSTAGR